MTDILIIAAVLVEYLRNRKKRVGFILVLALSLCPPPSIMGHGVENDSTSLSSICANCAPRSHTLNFLLSINNEKTCLKGQKNSAPPPQKKKINK